MSAIYYLSILWLLLELAFVLRDAIQGKGKTTRDKGTRNYNLLSLIISFILAINISEFTNFYFVGRRIDLFIWIGFGCIVIGIIIRIWSIITLGNSFRTTVEVHNNQKVITNGPYKFVRHPSYTGAIIICVGFGIAFQNWISLLIMIIIPMIGILHRINIEENEMIIGLGNDYIEYKKNTKKLFPSIW
jgi:protein-S-isoprenylcysteine O-methyltransferase Ste14